MSVPVFADRADAGRRLAGPVRALGLPDPLVVAVPRGGVPVAAELARALGAPLDVVLVVKVSAPGRSEQAVGAVGEDGAVVVDDASVRAARLDPAGLDVAVDRARAQLAGRVRRLRADGGAAPVAGRVVVLVDDGAATGATAAAAAAVLRARGARRLVLAVPVASAAALHRLRGVADDVVCVAAPEELGALARWYAVFEPVAEAAVRAGLAGAVVAARTAGAPWADRAPGGGPGREVDLVVPVGGIAVPATLGLPPDPWALVVVAHGTGSGRASPRNREVARALRATGIATVLPDLLTPEESADRRTPFDVDALAARLAAVTDAVRARPGLAGLGVGWYGASSGAAVALWAAAARPGVRAVVCRGGRPDLAAGRLPAVRAATLLVVGSRDAVVLGLNRQAEQRLGGPHRLAVVPGAGHLFEEPGALEEVSRLAVAWFGEHLPAGAGG